MSLMQQRQSTQNVDVTDLNYQIPTDDADVRSLLRSLQEPITLFGEGKPERRARLIKIISGNQELYQALINNDESHTEDLDYEMEGAAEEYYEPVSEDAVKCDELYDLRIQITKRSLHEAKAANAKQLQQYEVFDMTSELIIRRGQYEKLAKIELSRSKMVSNRPVSHVKFYRDEIITSSWNGELCVLAQDEELTQLSKRTEKERISKFDVNDQAIISVNFVGDLHVYDHGDSPAVRIPNLHESRISDVKFHPLVDNLVITASFDKTFKLFDLTKQQEIYQQFNTHNKEIFSLGVNSALLSTCGLDSVIRVWDLRSGKVISNLTGHRDGVYCTDWHPNGHQLISGSNDCTMKVWDLRNPGSSVVNLPLHEKLVSDVKVSDDGKFVVSSSYDNSVLITSWDNFLPITRLKGHDDKVITVDLSKDNEIISSGWDRSLKIWN